MSVAVATHKRHTPPQVSSGTGRWYPVSYADARRAGGLTPSQFRLWTALLSAPERRHSRNIDLPRTFILERAGIAATRDAHKKLPGRLRAIERAGLIRVAIDGDRVRYRVTGTPADPKTARKWSYARLWETHRRRMLDPDDPVSDALLQAWVCRWLHVLRLDRIQATQSDLAAHWHIGLMTVRREARHLAAAGLLDMRRTGAASLFADARLQLADDAPIRPLIAAETQNPRSTTSGTRDRPHLAPQPLRTLCTTRTRLDAAGDASGVTALQGRPPSNANETDTGAAGPELKRSPTPRLPDQAQREAWQLVRTQFWLATAPKRVRFAAAALIRWYLRRGGPSGSGTVWTVGSLGAALASADPGDGTTDHCRIIRAAAAGLVADAKAKSPASTDAAAPNLPSSKATMGDLRRPPMPDRLAEWRTALVHRAEAGPPADTDQLPEFLAGVLLQRHDLTGQPISVLSRNLGIAPAYSDALGVAAGTAAMIIEAGQQR